MCLVIVLLGYPGSILNRYFIFLDVITEFLFTKNVLRIELISNVLCRNHLRSLESVTLLGFLLMLVQMSEKNK